MGEQRTDYLSFEEYFMSVTALASLRNPKAYNGACLVDMQNRILSVGYDEIPYSIRKNHPAADAYTVSALSNTLYSFKGRRGEFEGGTLYLSSFPGIQESREIAQAHLKKVVYLIKDIKEEEEQIVRLILNCAGVTIFPYYNSTYSRDQYIQFLQEFKQVVKKHIGKSNSSFLTPDEYFMQMAFLSALRSKDPSTQVGACLVNDQDQILSIGYNGAPYGMSDDILPWKSIGEKTGEFLKIKNPYVVHAEINAFDNYRGNQDDLKNNRLYLLYSPCENCARRISSAGLKKVTYLRAYQYDAAFKRSMDWLQKANVVCQPYKEEREYSKEDSIRILSDTQKVIRKNLVYH